MKNGFTLVELMVVAALFGIISVIGGDILITVFRAYSKSKVISEIERNGNYAISLFNTEIRGGSDIELKSGGSCISGASECLTYVDATGVPSQIAFTPNTCTTKNGILHIIKNGVASKITNSDLISGVNVSSPSQMFSLATSGGITYVGFSAMVSQPCNSPVTGSAKFDTLVKVRGY